MEKIVCELCGNRYRRITNTHLFKKHQMSMEDYITMFPDSPIDAPGLAMMRVNHLRGKTYEGIYGDDFGGELRELRRQHALIQMENPEQILVRKKKCGYTASDDLRARLSEVNTIHGATTYRRRALDFYGTECNRCGFESEDESDFHVHHKDFLNINSELGNHNIDNLQVLCKQCHTILHNELGDVGGRFFGLNNIEKGVHYIFMGLKQELGLDLTDKNFIDTPKRVARAYAEILSGIKDTEGQCQRILSSSFPSEYSEMVVARNIRCFSMCPHHLLPVDYVVDIAYIPVQGGDVLGISKLSRLALILSKRLVIQEQFVCDITEMLMKLKGCAGAACVAKGKHYCMIMRGANQSESITTTSSLRGVFYDNPEVRAEFMSLIKNG